MCQVTVKEPNECSGRELRQFEGLVLLGSEVDSNGLADRIARAEHLGFAQQCNELTGGGAVKNPGDHYRNVVFRSAGLPEKSSLYTFELGWFYVVPALRGLGLSSRIVDGLLDRHQSSSMFATSASDKFAMHRLLEHRGFKAIGTKYKSKDGTRDIFLFVRDAE